MWLPVIASNSYLLSLSNFARCDANRHLINILMRARCTNWTKAIKATITSPSKALNTSCMHIWISLVEVIILFEIQVENICRNCGLGRFKENYLNCLYHSMNFLGVRHQSGQAANLPAVVSVESDCSGLASVQNHRIKFKASFQPPPGWNCWNTESLHLEVSRQQRIKNPQQQR